MVTTKKQVEAAFDALLKYMGKRRARPYSRSKGFDVGGYTLDHNALYGGYRIEQYMNNGGGVNTPFGPARHPPKEFVTMMHFAMDAAAIKRGRR